MGNFDKNLVGLREALNKWDPAGLIAVGMPEDEYNDLLYPVLKVLREGGREKEVASAVGQIVRRDYGIPFHDKRQRKGARHAVQWHDQASLVEHEATTRIEKEANE